MKARARDLRLTRRALVRNRQVPGTVPGTCPGDSLLRHVPSGPGPEGGRREEHAADEEPDPPVAGQGEREADKRGADEDDDRRREVDRPDSRGRRIRPQPLRACERRCERHARSEADDRRGDDRERQRPRDREQADREAADDKARICTTRGRSSSRPPAGRDTTPRNSTSPPTSPATCADSWPPRCEQRRDPVAEHHGEPERRGMHDAQRQQSPVEGARRLCGARLPHVRRREERRGRARRPRRSPT